MAMLKRGSKGDGVKRIQERLTEVGFRPGKIVGDFGPATVNFQHSREFLPDGIVGPKTSDALFRESIPPAVKVSAENVLPAITLDLVSRMFEANSSTKRNIEKFLASVKKALKEESLTDKVMVLMALSTIRAETAGFEPISEFKSKFNTSPGGHPFDRYDNRSDLGNLGKPDGANFKGRGFIQLTGRFNYTKYSERLGLGEELVKNPEKSNDPLIAARILALFLKDKEIKIKEAILNRSFKEAKKLVNGGRHGITAFENAYRTGEDLLG